MGAFLIALPPSTAVGLVPGGVRLGATLLPPNGPGSYGGGALPAMVVTHPGTQLTIASADGVQDGRRVRGRCELHHHHEAWVEECSFAVGAVTYRAEDLFNPTGGSGWQRRYSTGRRVTIPVPGRGTMLPVPFPIGLTL
ncbi:MAG: hypothetical protein M3010_07325 [Candidatus Dormibacteraeota bacterium]|nr:hypothetical protein [Candidatus Dormibacteraeota bacterium]